MYTGVMSAILRIAQIVPNTAAEGPGRRFALWFQGCPFRCPGCCNPEMLTFAGGMERAVADVADELRFAHERWHLEGVTLLGGEPLAQASGAAELAGHARRLGLSVMIFSGYTLEEAEALPNPAVAQLLALTDILVDGRYERDLPESARRWIGSANQRVHFLTERYRADDPCWRRPNTIELRWRDGELTINGFPTPGALSLRR